MQENKSTKLFRSKKIQTETYNEDGAFITKHYYDDKKNHVKERILVRGEHKEINSFTATGVFAKSENFLAGKRDGIETKYFIPKANNSIKSTKSYADGKLNGESITYNMNDEIIKQEVFALGKLVFKYLRNETFDIVGITVVDKDSIDNLPEVEHEKLQTFMCDKPEWF